MIKNWDRLAANLREALKEAGFFIFLALKAFKFWHRDQPVLAMADMARFADTRAKFVAQITLFGYIKTRAGTRYTQLFENETYAQSINIAKWEIFLACLQDIVIYMTARVGREAGATDAEMQAMASHILNNVLDNEEVPKERDKGFADIRETFDARSRVTVWDTSAEGEAAFRASTEALVHWAPIADELKQYDEEIVINSMRFKWKKVRDELADLLDAGAVLADWRSATGHTD